MRAIRIVARLLQLVLFVWLIYIVAIAALENFGAFFWVIGTLFAVANLEGVVLLSRRPDNAGALKMVALALVLGGVAAVSALLTFDLWYHHLFPLPPQSEWRDSLPGMGRAILMLQTLLTLAGAGLIFGWGLWGVAAWRDRRRAV